MKLLTRYAVSEKPRPIVVIDTQLILRATLNAKALPARMLFQLRNAYLLVVSPEVRAEVQDVLTRPKIRKKFPQITDNDVYRTMAVLDGGLQVQPDSVPAASRDPKDDKFLALAVTAKATYLVSEDKDLLVLDPYQEIRILNALEFLHELEKLAGDKPARPSETLLDDSPPE
jgi:putative PIN family toxin of toxin-antitoxin system